MIEEVVATNLQQADGRWQVLVADALGALPDSTAYALKQAVETTGTARRGSR